MKIAILNGNPSKNNLEFERNLKELIEQLSQSNQVYPFDLRTLNIKKCIGCFNCWLSNPGYCVLKDDMDQIYSSYMHVDLILFSSPIHFGFTSSILKRVQDRFCPLIHPHACLKQGEFQHAPRYRKYPSYAVLIDNKLDKQELEILTGIYKKSALSFSSDFLFISEMNRDIEGVVNEINNVKLQYS